MNHRPLRVQKLIREELSKIIARELEFDGALVTITEAEVDKKLEAAKVGVSVIPAKSAPHVLKALGASASRLQHLLKKKINIVPMPRVIFEIDYGPENAARIEKALLSK